MALLSCNFVFGQTTPLKIGYVDSQVILTQYPEAIKAQGDLDALTNQWGAHIDSLNQSLQKAYSEYQKIAKTLTAERRDL